MTDKVHGGVRGGEFLTGKMDFFTIDTLVSLDQTNVDTPSADLYQISASVWTPVTVVDGHGTANTYSTKSDYDNAYAMQQNLNKVLAAFAIRANPVMVSVSVRNYDVTGVFGSNFTGSQEVAQINIATEKSGLWFVDVAETNEAGYGLDVALNGVADMVTSSGVTKNTNIARRVAL
jgi:hypothetical protein